eukprot:scaffold289547_cov28-Tisochrysis_lutea.AAC.4
MAPLRVQRLLDIHASIPRPRPSEAARGLRWSPRQVSAEEESQVIAKVVDGTLQGAAATRRMPCLVTRKRTEEASPHGVSSPAPRGHPWTCQQTKVLQTSSRASRATDVPLPGRHGRAGRMPSSPAAPQLG